MSYEVEDYSSSVNLIGDTIDLYPGWTSGSLGYGLMFDLESVLEINLLDFFGH